MVYQRHNTNRLLNARSSKFVTKTKRMSCRNIYNNSLSSSLHCLQWHYLASLGSCLCSASSFTRLYGNGVPLDPPCPHSRNGERSRPELLHVSGQQVSVGPWGGLCWGGRSRKVGWSRRRAPSCCSLLQGMTFSQASDQLEVTIRERKGRNSLPVWTTCGKFTDSVWKS